MAGVYDNYTETTIFMTMQEIIDGLDHARCAANVHNTRCKWMARNSTHISYRIQFTYHRDNEIFACKASHLLFRGQDIGSSFAAEARLTYNISIEPDYSINANGDACLYVGVANMTHYGLRACAAVTLILSCRRLFRALLPIDIQRLLCRHVWATRMDKGWDGAHSVGGQRMIPTREKTETAEISPKKLKP